MNVSPQTSQNTADRLDAAQALGLTLRWPRGPPARQAAHPLRPPGTLQASTREYWNTDTSRDNPAGCLNVVAGKVQSGTNRPWQAHVDTTGASMTRRNTVRKKWCDCNATAACSHRSPVRSCLALHWCLCSYCCCDQGPLRRCSCGQQAIRISPCCCGAPGYGLVARQGGCAS
jgi:hypothetical protein